MPTTRYTVFDGEIVSESRAGVLHDYVSDPLGSTAALLDNTQTQTDQWAYFPYGESVRITGTSATPMTFLGRQSCRQDSTSTRSYMQNRVLDMRKARWMTEDPIGFQCRDRNLYRYVSNRTVTLTDPSGLMCKPGQGDILGPPKIQAPGYLGDFGKSKSRQDCNNHYGPKSYCSCMCQCSLQLASFAKQLKGEYQACLKSHPGPNGVEYCSLVNMGQNSKANKLDENCRLECLQDHRPPGSTGNPDTGPCKSVN